MKKKFLSLVLVLAFLLPAIISCSDKTNENPDDIDTVSSTENNNSTTELNVISDNLPEKNFGGYDFRIYTENHPTDREHYLDYVEEEIGEILNDAVYQRNKVVEERFNINIKPVWFTEWGTPGEKAILAGDDAFDIISTHGMIAYQYAGKNLVVDWMSSMPYVDLNAVWWNQNMVNENSYFGKLYTATGDITYSTLGFTMCLYFNKRLFQEFNLEYPYEDVINGTWTIDKFFSIVKNGAFELNGDGVMTPEDDRYGFAMGNIYYYPVGILYSGGDKVIKKDDNNLPVLSIYNERTVNIYDKFFDLLDSKTVFIGEAVHGTNDSIRAFMAGRALFYDRGMNGAIFIREMEDEVGIVPFPKYDEQTPKYYSLMEAGARMITVPINAMDYERTSIIVEALAVEGYKIITPAYYETTLKTKHSRDDESAEMLDYIRDSAVVDYGYLNRTVTEDLGLLGTTLLEASDHNFTSFYEKRENKVQLAIKKLIEDNTK